MTVKNPLSRPAHLRDPDYRRPTESLKTIAGMKQAAHLGNLASNFGVGSVALTKGPFQCPPGYGLYAGQCIPKTPTLSGPAPQTSKRPYSTYQVRIGNSASDIAAAHGVTLEALIAANPDKPVMKTASGRTVFARLQEGERLHIPASHSNLSGPGVVVRHQAPIGRTCLTQDGHAGYDMGGKGCKAILAKHPTVTVGKGESAQKIAARHGVSMKALLEANPHKPLSVNKSGAAVFARVTPGEKLRIPVQPKAAPQRRIERLSTPLVPGGQKRLMTQFASLGDPCNPDDPDFDVADCAAAQAGGGQQSSGQDPQDPQGQTSISGTIFCQDPNAHIDLTVLPDSACVCDDGYAKEPTTGVCTPLAQTDVAQAACAASGGTWDGKACSGGSSGDLPSIGDSCGKNATIGTDTLCHCDAGYDWTPGTTDCVKSNKPGGATSGGKAVTTSTKKPVGGTTPAVNPKSALTTGSSSTLMVLGGVAAAAVAVGFGAYFLAKPKKGAAKDAKHAGKAHKAGKHAGKR